MSPRGGMPGALPQNEKKLNYTVISFFWHVSSWKTYDVSSVHVSLSAPPSSNLNSGQIHSSLQTLLTLNQQQTSFPYEILGTKSYQMRVWSLICLYSGGRDIKTSRKPWCRSKSGSTFLTWGYSRRGRGANSWGVATAWLRLEGILVCWSLVLIIASKNWQHSSTAAGLQGHGLTGGRINHWARVPLTVWNFIWQNRETNPDVYSGWLLSLSTGWSNPSTPTLANINSAGVFALGAEPPTSCGAAVRQLNLTSDPLVGKRTDNVSTRSNKGVFAAQRTAKQTTHIEIWFTGSSSRSMSSSSGCTPYADY